MILNNPRINSSAITSFENRTTTRELMHLYSGATSAARKLEFHTLLLNG